MGLRFRCCRRRQGRSIGRWHRLVRKVVIVQQVRERWAALGRFLQRFRRL